MNNQWLKLGLLYCPDKHQCHPKLMTHAANPLAVLLENDVYRVFYSGRDNHNRSSIGAVDVDIVRQKIIRKHYKPFFLHGDEGSFYADGVSIGNCYRVNGIQYMLFMGWQTRHCKHWRGDIGRLIVHADKTLRLDDNNPFLGSNDIDPISLSYPWVMPDDMGGYHMWYGSTQTWDAGNNEMVHTLNYASSKNGHDWQRKGLAVPYEIGIAQAFSRPTVIEAEKGQFQMWFSYRSGTGEKYRIGYASRNGEGFWALDLKNSGITTSVEGWDSEMIEYPFVFAHKGEKYMLYNGNDHGKTGFGLAVLNTEKAY